MHYFIVVWDGIVSIATHYRLDDPGTTFSAPIQTGPGAHPASYTMGTWSFLGVKRLGCGVDHTPPSSAKVKERAELYFWAFMACSRVNYNFTFMHYFIKYINCVYFMELYVNVLTFRNRASYI